MRRGKEIRVLSIGTAVRSRKSLLTESTAVRKAYTPAQASDSLNQRKSLANHESLGRNVKGVRKFKKRVK